VSWFLLAAHYQLCKETSNPLGEHRNRRLQGGAEVAAHAIHAGQKLTRAERNTPELDFEVFVATIIFDRNAQVRFHKPVITGAVKKTSYARRRARAVVY
jgi:hypothetical protein